MFSRDTNFNYNSGFNCDCCLGDFTQMKIKKFKYSNLSLKKKLAYKRDLNSWKLLIKQLEK